MAIVRGVFFLLLLAAAACFAIFALTGEQRFRRIGMTTFKWTLLAGLVLFALLIVQRLSDAG